MMNYEEESKKVADEMKLSATILDVVARYSMGFDVESISRYLRLHPQRLHWSVHAVNGLIGKFNVCKLIAVKGCNDEL